MIQVESLRAGYRAGFRRRWVEVLQGLSFRVPRGSITGYLGVNGAGKTTTIKVLVGINPPSAGTVRIGGHPAGSREAQLLLGFSPEAPFFYEGLSGRELLAFFARLSGVPASARAARADALLQEVGLWEARDEPVKGYSKGMRQRLGLAQALVHGPELLILDEPLDGLDPMGRLQLRELILRQRAEGRTVFFSSHVLSDVEAVSDQLVVLNGGTVAYEGPAQGLSGEAETRVDLRLGGLDATGWAQVQEAAQAAGEELAAQARGEGCWELVCAGQEAVDRLVDATRTAGGRVLAVEPRRPSLEETFLRRFSAPPAGAPAAGAPAGEGS